MNYSKRYLEEMEEREFQQRSNQRTPSNSERIGQIQQNSGYALSAGMRQEEANFERRILLQNQQHQQGNAQNNAQSNRQSSQNQDDAFAQTKARIIYGLSRQSGDCIGFLSAMRSSISNLTPIQASSIVQDMMGTMKTMIRQLDSKAKESDGGQETSSLEIKARQFDKAVANLSSIMTIINGCSQGSGLASSISATVTDLIRKRDDIGRWDEALGNTLVNGDYAMMKAVKNGNDVKPSELGKGSSILATQVVELLGYGKDLNILHASDATKAKDILQNIEKGAQLLAEASEKLTQRTATDQSLIEVNIANWGGMATDEQLNRAIEAERKSHGTFDQLEAMAGNTLAIFDDLHRLSKNMPEGDLKEKLSERVLQYRGHFDDAIALTHSAQKQAQMMLEDWENSLPYEREKSLVGTIISEGNSIGGEIARGTKGLKMLANLYLSSEINQMISSAQSANTNRLSAQMNTLMGKAKKLGLDADALEELENSFQDMIDSGYNPNSLSTFNQKINKVEAFANASAIGTGLRTVAFIIASFDVIHNVTNDEEMDAKQVLEIASSAVGLGQAGVALLSKNVVWKNTAQSILKSTGKGLGIIGLGIDAVGMIGDLKEGDYASAGLGALGILGGVLGFTSFSGVGFAISIATIVIGMQVQKVKASNVLETKHTEAFLQELGIPQEVAHHLRNADSEGRSIGNVLTAVMKDQHISPEIFLTRLNALNSNQAKNLAEACHGVDPGKNNTLPQTDENAQFAGMTPEEFNETGLEQVLARPSNSNNPYSSGTQAGIYNIDQYIRPHSIKGLVNYIRRKGIPLFN